MIGGGILLAVGAVAVAFWYLRATPQRRVALVAQRARAEIDPHELQAWAVSVLAQKPRPKSSQLEHMKILQDIHRLYEDKWKFGPFVEEDYASEDNTEDFLWVAWGSGFGHWGFLIGSPSFKTSDRFLGYLDEWIPGVYFFAN